MSPFPTNSFRLFSRAFLSGLLLCVLLAGCAGTSSEKPDTSSMHGTRDHTPKVLTPSADAVSVLGTEDVSLDVSHTEDGYFCASYRGASEKVKLQSSQRTRLPIPMTFPPTAVFRFFRFPTEAETTASAYIPT